MKIFFYNKNSYLNNLNPLSKVITMIPVLIFLCMVNDVWIPFSFILFTIILVIFFGKVPIKDFIKIIAPISIFSFSILILFIFASRSELTLGSPIIFSIGPFNIYKASLYAGIVIAARISSLLLLTLPFGLTTEPSDFIRSIIQNLNVPYKFSYGIIVAFRFLLIIDTEFQIVKSAYNVMGVSEGNSIKSYFSKLKRYSIPLIVNAIRIGERTALSMDSRCFGAFENVVILKK